VAATMATDEVFHQFLGPPEERLTFFHGHSFGGKRSRLCRCTRLARPL